MVGSFLKYNRFKDFPFWKPTDGSHRFVKILDIKQFGDGDWDYEVYYEDEPFGDGIIHNKDIWNFQVRYEPLGS